MGFFPFGAAGNGVLARTPVAGFPLQNAGSVNILTWTAPADGQSHFVNLTAQMTVTVAQTGGQVNIQFTDPTGTFQSRQAIGGSNPVGFTPQTNVIGFVVQAGTTVYVVQTSAQTAGAASVWAVLTGG